MSHEWEKHYLTVDGWETGAYKDSFSKDTADLPAPEGAYKCVRMERHESMYAKPHWSVEWESDDKETLAELVKKWGAMPYSK